MTRKLKVLSLTLAAAFVMSVVSASSALATKDFKTEGNAKVTLKGVQDEQDVLVTDSGKTKCTTATYLGTVENSPTTTFNLTPTYSGCTALATLVHATINPHGCKYQFHISGETANGSATGTVDIVCEGGEIEIVAESGGVVKCTTTIPGQTGLGLVEFTNVNPGGGTTKEVTVDVNIVGGIEYSQKKGSGGGACGDASKTTNGQYAGKALITGLNDNGAGHIGVFIE